MTWATGSASFTDAGYMAAFAEPAKQYRVRLALHLVSGVSPSFTTRYVGDLPYLGGPALQMSARNAVVRTLTVQTPLARVDRSIAEALQAVQYTGGTFSSLQDARLPADPKSLNDALTAGAYVNVMVGMDLPSVGQAGFVNVERQIAQLSVRRVTGADGGVATLELADWMAVVDENPLITTYAPVDGSGNPISRGAAVEALIAGAFPTGWIGSVIPALSLADATLCKAGLSFTGSRFEAIGQLLDPTTTRLSNSSTGAFFYDQDRVRTGSAGSTQWEFGTGRAPTPIFDYSTELAENAGFNGIPLNWQSSDGASFGLVFLVDSDPASATYWNGPYGHRPAPIEAVDAANSEAEAITVATQRLAASKLRQRKVTVQTPIAPVEANDTVRLRQPYLLNPAQTVTESLIVETVDFPLAAGSMTLSGYVSSRAVA